MLIVLALVIGAALGGALHLAAPARSTRGAALGPFAGAALAGAVWAGLTWVGLGEDNPWLWFASLAAAAVGTAALLLALARVRTEHDARERARLGLI